MSQKNRKYGPFVILSFPIGTQTSTGEKVSLFFCNSSSNILRRKMLHLGKKPKRFLINEMWLF